MRSLLDARSATLLKNVRLFRTLNPAEFESIASSAQRVVKEPHEDFFRQTQPARRIFVVNRGRVKLTQLTPEGYQIVVRYAGEGDMFGCVPLFGGNVYPATATALTRCETLAWDHQTIAQLMQESHQMMLNALEELGRELQDVRERYLSLATERVERRIARALLRLVQKAGKRTSKGVLIEFPLTRQDLAELTGTTLHTVSRILTRWGKDGLIVSGRRKVIIRNPHGLVAIAEDLHAEGQS